MMPVQAGKRYYSGFMGRTRVLLLHSGDREHKGETVQIWRLVVSETEPREGQPAARQSPTPPRASTSLGRAPAGLAAP
jgi:hypothetical protein